MPILQRNRPAIGPLYRPLIDELECKNGGGGTTNGSSSGSSTCSSDDQLYPPIGPVVPDDIWNKFELPDMFNFDFKELMEQDDEVDDMSTLFADGFFDGAKMPTREEEESAAANFSNSIWSLSSNEPLEIRNHDCMWAGTCGSKEHPTDEPSYRLGRKCKYPSLTFVAPVPLTNTTTNNTPSNNNNTSSSTTPSSSSSTTSATTTTIITPQKESSLSNTVASHSNHTTQNNQSSGNSIAGPNNTTENSPALAKQYQTSGRSILLKNKFTNNVTVNNPNTGFGPDTPPMSDDEEAKAAAKITKNSSSSLAPALSSIASTSGNPTPTLQLLESAIERDLCEYLDDENVDDVDFDHLGDDEIGVGGVVETEENDDEDEEEDEEEEEDDDDEEEDEEDEDVKIDVKHHHLMTTTPTRSASPGGGGMISRQVVQYASSDHCYHIKDTTSSIAYETPSDSDDEIDVVSVTENQPSGNARLTAGNNHLPHNPSTRDRHKLQRTVATAMSNKCMQQTNYHHHSGGVGGGQDNSSHHHRLKTLLPLRNHNNNQGKSTKGGGGGGGGEYSPAKRRAITSNVAATKRTKYQGNGGGSPLSSPHKTYRKRGGGGGGNSSNATTVAPPSQQSSPHNNNHHSSDDSDEPEPSEKRSLHNNMERQRRIDLRNAFEYLRVLVPEVNKRDRAAKVVILREATSHCNYLGVVNDSLLMQMDELKENQKRLRARVSQLRRSLAQKHR